MTRFPRQLHISRRTFIAQAGLAAHLLTRTGRGAALAKPKVAAVFTELKFRSHAFNILENFLGPYLFCGQRREPLAEVVSLYADQFPEDDMTRDASRRYQIPLYPTIEQSLCLGGSELAVDAVLLIGEHGDYPYNELGQQLYPRKRFFDESLAVMHRAQRYVPIFNDKHLSYRWDWAKEMFDASRQHGFPMLAGSSVPLAQRRPPLDLPLDADIEEAVAIHGGGWESYDFHGIELLQSIIESRRGGETGIDEVQVFTGESYAAAGKDGLWSPDLVRAAQQAEANLEQSVRRQSRPRVGVFAAPQKTVETHRPEGDYAIRILYRDGLRATVLRRGSSSDRWLFACRLRGESAPRATSLFNSSWGNRGLFMALSHAIQHLFVERREPYPLERTLIATGVVEAAVRARVAGGTLATPHLSLRYVPNDFAEFRENGRSWEILTVDTPQTTQIENRFP
jgi:hypothetical protein